MSLQALREENRRIVREGLNGGLLRVLVDATHPACQVPVAYKQTLMLALNLSYRYTGADMEFTDEALHVTLTFEKKAFRCTLPWEAFLAAQHMPSEPPQPEMPRPARHLRLVK
jgi:hypothetical protein